MKACLRRVCEIALTLIVVVVLGAYLYSQKETIVESLRIDSDVFFIISLATFASWLANTIIAFVLMRAVGAELPFMELLALHAAAGLLNHLPFRAGTVYRATYLKHAAGLQYAHFGVFLLTSWLLLIVASGAVGAATVLIFYGLESQAATVLLLCFGALVLGGIMPLAVRLPRLTGQGRLALFWNDLVQGRDQIVRHPLGFLVVLLCQTAAFAAAAFRFVGAFACLQIPASFAECLLVGTVGMLTTLVSITPSGLGVYEFVVGAVATVGGVPFSTGVLAAVVIRAVILLWYVLLGIPALVCLTRLRRRRKVRATRPA